MKATLLILTIISLAGCQTQNPKMTVISPDHGKSPIENRQSVKWVKKGNVFYLELHHSK